MAKLPLLTQLELIDNEVSRIDDYRETIYKLIPQLKVLDQADQDNQSFYSDDFEDMNEEGEAEMEEIIKNLDPETREKFEKGELNEEDLKGMGLLPFGDDESYGDADYGDESGEQDQNGDEGEDHKRQKQE